MSTPQESHACTVSSDTHLSAAVVTLITLEPLLILVSLLMLDEGVPLVEHGIAVAAFLSCLNERMLFPQVDACNRKKGSATVHQGCKKTHVQIFIQLYKHIRLFIFNRLYVRLPIQAAEHRFNTAKNTGALRTQVTFACDDGITMGTVELCNILCVFLQNVHLHGAALCETRVTDVALVWLLACDMEERRQ